MQSQARAQMPKRPAIHSLPMGEDHPSWVRACTISGARLQRPQTSQPAAAARPSRSSTQRPQGQRKPTMSKSAAASPAMALRDWVRISAAPRKREKSTKSSRQRPSPPAPLPSLGEGGKTVCSRALSLGEMGDEGGESLPAASSARRGASANAMDSGRT